VGAEDAGGSARGVWGYVRTDPNANANANACANPDPNPNRYIMVLVSVNLVGYAVGVGGMQVLLDKLLCLEGLRTLVASFWFLSCGVCIMSALRREKVSS